jgi:hypothetical protein
LQAFGEPGAIVYLADCMDLMKIIPPGSVDVVFADPPYRLSTGGVTVKSGRLAPVDKGVWDRSMGLVRTRYSACYSAYLCGYTTCRGRGTVSHQSESAHQTSHWTGLCRILHTDY